ncbi:MAG TPA: DinB family protein [Gemmatimonadales bacterium]|nr:DinB family protein [Gemmatimonadales bacterium]
MTQLTSLRQMHQHAAWADAAMINVVASNGNAIPEVLREFAHIMGAGETWLSRILGRDPRLAVWPTLDAGQIGSTAAQIASGYTALLAGLDDAGLERVVTYVNSAGARFTNSVADILTHVALHAQYHRGKINLLLREGGAAPVPTDFIGYIRGAPAATEARSRPPETPHH